MVTSRKMFYKELGKDHHSCEYKNMSDTCSQLYCKVLKSRRHFWTYCLFLFSVVEAVQASNDWPQYKHPDSSTQQCYMCPPGFYKEKDCALTRDKSVQLPMCRPCPDSQYSQRWNTDGRCWDHDSCEKNHEVVYNGGKTGPMKCACNGSSLEDENGVCVEGITSSKHHATLNQLRASCDARVKSATRKVTVTPAKSTATQPPCTTTKETAPSCPMCGVCEGSSEGLSAEAGIVIGCVLGIIATSLVFCVYKGRKKHTQDEKNGHTSAQNGHGPSSDRQSASLKKQGTPMTPISVVVDLPKRQAKEKKNEQGSRLDGRHDEGVNKPDGDKVEDKDERKGSEVESTLAVTEEQKKSLEERKRKKLLDDALRIMEKEVTIKSKADYVIRHVLGLSADECTSIRDKETTSEGVLRDGFGRWEGRKESKEATVENLVAALLKHDHRMMAEKITAGLKLNLKLESEHDEIDEFDDVIKICEKMLGVDDEVVEFFRSSLELDNEVTGILSKGDGKFFIREVLQKWQAKNGKSATAEKLIQLLIDADMKNEADGIRKELNRQNLGAASTFEPAENVSNLAVPFPTHMAATNGGGPSGLSASDSRPRSRSIASDTQGSSTSTRTRDTRNSRWNRGPSEEAPRPHSLGNPIADARMESGTTMEPPSTSYPSGPMQPQEGDLASECKRVEKADNTSPIEHFDYAYEHSGIGGKSARDTRDDMQSLDKGDTKALKPGTYKLTDCKPDTKPKETSESDPLLETLAENDKNKKKKKKRSKIREAYV